MKLSPDEGWPGSFRSPKLVFGGSAFQYGVDFSTDQNRGPHVGGCADCRGLVTIDLSDPAKPVVKPETDYYVLGHASKFVFPGAVRIASDEPAGTQLKDVAFRNPDGTVVLYTVNNGTNSQALRIGFHGKTVTANLPAGSVATFVWKP